MGYKTCRHLMPLIVKVGSKYSPLGIMLNRAQVIPVNKNIQINELFLDILSMISQYSRHDGISINDANAKFRYLLPAMSVAFIVNP